MTKLIPAVLGAAFSLLLAIPTLADRALYSGIVDLTKSSDALSVEHHHDWRNPLQPSSLRGVDRTTGEELFNQAAPAITYLWISPDSRYVVGLSNIRYKNQYQLVVLSRSGQELLKKDISKLDWAQPTASVTNWLHWYKAPEPRITLDESTHTLEVEDAGGVMRSFQI